MTTELVSYEGERNERGEPHGQGVSIDTDGDRWEGEFKNGYPDGNGVYTYTSGGRYEGDVKRELYDGRGTYWANSGRDKVTGESMKGYRYEGEWKDGKKHGYGIMHFPKGNRWFYTRYEGDWEDNLWHGRGTLFYNEDNPGAMDYWEGDFVKGNLIEGDAKIAWNSSQKYIGAVKEGPSGKAIIDGVGLLITPDGVRVKGVFRYDTDDYSIRLVKATTPGNQERWDKIRESVHGPRPSRPTSSQPSTSGGLGFWEGLGAFAGGFLGGLGGAGRVSGSSSSGNTWQCIMGHTMTSTFNPGSCSWCGNTMFPK